MSSAEPVGGGGPPAETAEPPASSPVAVDPPKPVEGGSKNESQVGVGSINGNDCVVTGIYQESHEYSIFFADQLAQGELGGSSGKLTRGDFKKVAWDSLEATVQNTVCDHEETFRFVEVLRKHHILLLEGAAEIGKRHLALKVASLLGGSRPIDHVWRLAGSPAQNKRVDFDSLLSTAADQDKHKNRKGIKEKTGESFERSVIIVEDAFRSGNRDLLRIVKDTDATGRESFKRILERSQSWLIFTFDEDRLLTSHPAMSEVRQRVKGPDTRQLLDFLETRSKFKLGSQERDEASCDEIGLRDFISANGFRIVQVLATPPRIERFVSVLLTKVLAGELSLEKALIEADRLDNWLLEDVINDISALTYVLALTICNCSPDRSPVRWYEFDEMRRLLADYLRRQLGGEQKEPRDSRELCAEPDLVQRLQVEVTTDSKGPQVAFKDERRAERVWTFLLGNGRQLAGLLVPWLESLTTHKHIHLRRRAGWCLGILGQLDHQALFGRLFAAWSAKIGEPASQMAAPFGAMLQSIYEGPDAELKELCVSRLRDLLRHGNPQYVRGGLIALSDLGLVDLGFAMTEMGSSLRKWLVPRLVNIDDFQKLRQRTDSFAKEIGAGSRLRSELGDMFDEELERQLYANLPTVFPPERELKILIGAHFSLVRLCLMVGTVPVLRELKLWIAPENPEMAPLIALLVLRPHGLAEFLEGLPKLEVGELGEESWSPILCSAAREDRGSEELADFLFEVFLGACQLPTMLERALIARWLGLIETWTRQAAVGSTLRNTVIAVWCRLLRAQDYELRERLEDLLNHPDLDVRGTRLGAMVHEIRLRRALEKATAG